MVTKEQAMTHQTFYHVTLRYRSGDRGALQVRVNGACKTWKTRPDDFRLPVKYGLRECLYITPTNAHEWSVDEPAAPITDPKNGV